MEIKNIETTVKDVIKKTGAKPKKIEQGWVYEVSARGNAYQDFRDEYQADIIDDRLARKAFPNTEQEESYLVVMSSENLGKAKLKEVHNVRFAEYANNSVVVKVKEDLIEDLMKKLGIQPGKGIR